MGMSVLNKLIEQIAYQLSYWEDEPSAIHMILSARMVSSDGKVEERAEVPLVTCKNCRFKACDGDYCYRVTHEFVVEPDGFCAWAERRDAYGS